MKSLHVQKNMDFWVENLVGAADALISIFSLSVCDRAACSKLLHLLFLPAPVSSSFPPPSAPFYLPSPPLPFSPFSLLINLFFSKVCVCTCNYHTHTHTHTHTHASHYRPWPAGSFEIRLFRFVVMHTHAGFPLVSIHDHTGSFSSRLRHRCGTRSHGPGVEQGQK